MRKRNKFGAVKTEVDGIKFDSKKEASYYNVLKQKELDGEIHGLRLQVPYLLQEKFMLEDGTKIREIKYIADFDYYDSNGVHHTVDVKGKVLDVFKLKAKLFAYKYGRQIEIV